MGGCVWGAMSPISVRYLMLKYSKDIKSFDYFIKNNSPEIFLELVLTFLCSQVLYKMIGIYNQQESCHSHWTAELDPRAEVPIVKNLYYLITYMKEGFDI